MNAINPAIRRMFPRMNNKIKERQFIDLGKLGDEVEIEGWYDVDIDDDNEPFVQIRGVYIIGLPGVISKGTNAMPYLQKLVIYELEEVAMIQEGIE